MKHYFRPYAAGDLVILWDNLRQEDKQELQGLGYDDPTLLERLLPLDQIPAFTWVAGNTPVACLGVTPTDERGVGLIWALASEEARPHWRFAVRHTEAIIQKLGEDYLVLTNTKDARNKQQIRWLQRCGFTFFHKATLGDREYLQFARIMK